jgi:subtilase family serine protease
MRKKWRVGRRAAVIVAILAVFAAFASGAAASPILPLGPIGPSVAPIVNPFGPCRALPVLNCYVPGEIRAAYDYPAHLDGSGQTIVIVDAYDHPFIEQSLARFDGLFGIPDPAPGKFVVLHGPRVTQGGIPPGEINQWSQETAVDVEWAHAMAPAARIVLVEAATADDADIAAAEALYLPQFPRAIVSQSFGVPEPVVTPSSLAAYHTIFLTALLRGGTIVASTGDFGANWTPLTGDPSGPALAAYPASDPLVTAVGGTMGLTHDGSDYGFGLLQNGAYGAEQVWNDPRFGPQAATGGAPSQLFQAPPWQRPVSPYKTRTVPDVAYNAALDGGIYVVYTDDEPASTSFGVMKLGIAQGTSTGSPQWAAIFALANQARAAAGKGPVGFVNDTLYKIAKQHKTADAFHDITVGNNALFSDVGFAAAPGYDAASGLGTPDVAKLIQALVTTASGRPDDVGPGNGHLQWPGGTFEPHRILPG